MKQAALQLLHTAGAFAPFRSANRNKALIVMYHRISADELPGRTATTARAFAEQLDYLARHYRVVPLSFITERLARGEHLPAGVAAITIDDGYADVYSIAFPLLRKHNMPATAFVVTDFLDGQIWLWPDKVRFIALRARAAGHATLVIQPGDLNGEGNGSQPRETTMRRFTLHDDAACIAAAAQINSWLRLLPDTAKDEAIERLAAAHGVKMPQRPTDEYGPLTWDEARELDAGGVSVEAHTVTHPILPNVDDDRLGYELYASRARLETMLGRRVQLFCYPNGDSDARVHRAVAQAGYTGAVTTLYGFNDHHSDVFALRRIHSEYDLAHFVQCTSGFEGWKNGLRRT